MFLIAVSLAHSTIDNYFRLLIADLNFVHSRFLPCRSRKSIHRDIARGGEDRLDLVHNNRANDTGVWLADAQHPHVHLQVVQETAAVALSPSLYHGNVSHNGRFLDVHGGASRTGRRQGSDADQLCMLRPWVAR